MDNVPDLLQRLAFSQAGVTAIHGRKSQPLKLIDRFTNGMQIKVHGAEKSASRQEIKTRESDQKTGLKIIVAHGQL